jgi:glycosyltransferase involved in cell wall biosynthesis
MNPGGKLLTLAIPTYNRACILDRSLCIIQPQLEAYKNDVEFIVSDNCSQDTTNDVVRRYIEAGMLLRYIRNDTNIGAVLNIIQCWKAAKGKYVWVVGDDDYLTENALRFILDILHGNKDYGLLFQPMHPRKDSGYIVCNTKESVFSNIDPFIGWISGNIIQKKYIDAFDYEVHKTDEHIYSWNTSAILNWTAVADSEYNVVICEKIFSSTVAAGKTSEKYNCFKETTNDVAIMDIYRKRLRLGIKYFERYKYIAYRYIINGYVQNVLFKKRDMNLLAESAWYYLFKYYWYEPYFYIFLIRCIIKHVFALVCVSGK